MAQLTEPLDSLTQFDWLRSMRGAALSASARAVAAMLITYADYDGGNARPGTPKLIEATGLSEASVKRGLAALRSGGWVRVVSRGGRSGDGTLRATTYQLTIPPRGFLNLPEKRLTEYGIHVSGSTPGGW